MPQVADVYCNLAALLSVPFASGCQTVNWLVAAQRLLRFNWMAASNYTSISSCFFTSDLCVCARTALRWLRNRNSPTPESVKCWKSQEINHRPLRSYIMQNPYARADLLQFLPSNSTWGNDMAAYIRITTWAWGQNRDFQTLCILWLHARHSSKIIIAWYFGCLPQTAASILGLK